MIEMMVKMLGYHLASLRWAAFYVVPLALMWTFTRLDPPAEIAILIALAYAANMVKPAAAFTRNSTARATIIYASLALVAVALFPLILALCGDLSWQIWHILLPIVVRLPSQVRSYFLYFPIVISYAISIFISVIICTISGLLSTFFVVKTLQNVSRKES